MYSLLYTLRRNFGVNAMLMIPTVILAIDSDNDRAYMTLLYRQYRSLMLKTAWNYTRVAADVEDIVSDSCTALIENLNTIRDLECNVLRAYIVTTVRNKAIDFCRKQKRLNAKFLHIDEEVVSQVADTDTVEKKVLLHDEIEQVRSVLLRLPERERDVLRLKYQVGLRDSEIAAMIGLAESSVRKYVERARKHLKASLY